MICSPIRLLLKFSQGVEMNRFTLIVSSLRFYSPHRRGDEPQVTAVSGSALKFSPQAWG